MQPAADCLTILNEFVIMIQRSSFVLGQPIGASGCNWGIRLQLELSGWNCSFESIRKIEILTREPNGRTADIETCSKRARLAKEEAARTQK